MTTSIAASDAPAGRALRRRRHRQRGFSLIELLVAMGLASLALMAVFSTAIFVARSCLATTDYTDMNQEARIALEVFSRDVRMASNVTDFSTNAVTLDVVTASGTTSVNYTYVPAIGALYREYGEAGQKLLIRDIEWFQLSRYSIATDSSTGQPLAATNHLETKQIQLALRSVRSGPARSAASNNVVSARYVLRNKIAR